jgi:EmrB/QacA subfamily drug resistance transporter
MKTSKNILALAGVCLSSLMFGLEISSVPVILPTLKTTLQGDFSSLQWVMNAYTIACTTVLMAIGALSDRYGRKRIFLISVALFGLSSLCCGLTHQMNWLIACRALQGMSGGAMLTCQVATLAYQFQTPEARSGAFSWWGIIFGIGLGFGPIIGAGIVAVASWQWVFLVHVFISAVTFVILLIGVKEAKPVYGNKLDVSGTASLSLCVLFTSYFIIHGSADGFTHPYSLAALLIAVISIGVFIITENRVTYPVFDLSVFKIPSFSGALLGSVGMNISFWPFMVYLPIYFQTVLGYNNSMTGMSILAYSLPPLLLPPVGEKLALRFRPGNIIPIGLLSIGLGFLLIWLGSQHPKPSWLTLLPGLLIAGAGLGITNTTVSNTTTASVDVNKAGMASGIDMSARMITLAINIAVMGAIVITHGFGLAMLYGAAGVCCMALCSFMLFRRKNTY